MTPLDFASKMHKISRKKFGIDWGIEENVITRTYLGCEMHWEPRVLYCITLPTGPVSVSLDKTLSTYHHPDNGWYWVNEPTDFQRAELALIL